MKVKKMCTETGQDGWLFNRFLKKTFTTFILATLIFFPTHSFAAVNQWVSVLAGSNAFAMLIDPANSTTFYLAEHGNGILKSTDGGATWVPANTGLSSLSANAIVADPLAPAGTFYVGTTRGVNKTTDSGLNWTYTGPFRSTIYPLAIVPATPPAKAVLYTGLGFSGIYKSTDAGATWVLLNNGITPGTNNGFTNEFAIHPTNPSIVYAGTRGGVFKSINGGALWSGMNTGLPLDSFGSLGSVQALKMSPGQPNTLYAGYSTNISDGIWKTVDGGANWTTLGLNNQKVNSILIDPATPTTIYVGTQGVGAGFFKTTNGGASWAPMNAGLPAGNKVAKVLSMDPVTKAIYAAVVIGLVQPGSGLYKFATQQTNTDLALTKTGSPNSVQMGNNITYTINVSNNGPVDPATGVTITDTLPAGITFVSSTSTSGTCNVIGATVTCNLGNVTMAVPATVTITVMPTQAGQITNTATVTGNENDPTPSNNTATAVTSAVTTISNRAPTASSVTIAGTATIGNVLSGTYAYADVDGDAQGTSTFRWLRNGAAIIGATTATYAIVAADSGKTIKFEVTPVAVTGTSPGTAAASAGTIILNSAPTATGVTISGAAQAGNILTGAYTYADGDGDLEGASTFRWLRNGAAITGATASTYILVAADIGTSITFEVTPVAATGTTPGIAVASTGTAVVAPISINFSAPVNFTVESWPRSVTSADFNGDGNVDMAVANSASRSVSVLLGNGLGDFAAAVNFTVGNQPTSVTIADFNGDGNADMAVANWGSRSVSVLLGDGLGGFAAAVSFAVGVLPSSVTSADFNGDGNADMAVANWGSGSVSVLLGDGMGGFAAAANFAAGRIPSSVKSADFNGDGNADIAVTNSSLSGFVSVLFGDGLGTFAAATNFAVGQAPFSLTIADFNGDGKADMAVANRDSANVSVLLGDGLGGFATAVNFVSGITPNSITSADFNGDGKVDLATANYVSGNVFVLKGDGLGGFATPLNFAAGSGAYSVTSADFNGDGKADMAVANSVSSNVSVLLAIPNSAPTATVPLIDYKGGKVNSGVTVNGIYSYSDREGDIEGASTFRWLLNGVPIPGANTRHYTIVAADSRKTIKFEVTPVALTGTLQGTAVTSFGQYIDTGSGGGCVINPTASFDPTMLGILLLSGLYALRRRKDKDGEHV